MGTHKNITKYKLYTVWGTQAGKKHGTGTGETNQEGQEGQEGTNMTHEDD